MMILRNYSYESKSPSKAIFLILARVACSDFRAVGRSENLGGNQYLIIKGFLVELVLRPNRPKSHGTNAPSPSWLYGPSLSLVLVELWGTSFLGTIWRNNQSLATAMACFCGCGLNSQEGYG